MNKTIFKASLAAALALLAAAGCKSPLEDAPTGGTGASGVLVLSIAGAETGARTLAPNLSAGIARCELTFTGPEGKTHEAVTVTGGSASVTLGTGQWTVTATGYAGTGESERAAARGSAEVTITDGGSAAASITLKPVTDGEQGTFSWNVTGANMINTATLALTAYPSGAVEGWTTVDLKTTPSGTFNLAAGYYIAAFTLTRTVGGTSVAARTEILHIYPGLTTEAAYTFTADDFQRFGQTKTGVIYLSETLASLPANDEWDPHTLAFSSYVNISSYWGSINSSIQTAKKYVILKFYVSSETDTITGSDNPSNNDMNIIKNNEYIKGVILQGGITVIGRYAFRDCIYLTSVTIPSGLFYIYSGAFSGCTGLTSVTIPSNVKSIEGTAFYGCTRLTSVTFTQSNISLEYDSFPGNLNTSYYYGGAGTYTRTIDGSTWTKKQ
ncbi:MAG: leucine-rich repeat domain-containing protein [Treponema sp.]|nr:leucine-rich repeat domain-containing protein [Treponema sp.]